jgi:hypothetical protein
MTFSRPIQWYHSHADSIWPDGTFKGFFRHAGAGTFQTNEDFRRSEGIFLSIKKVLQAVERNSFRQER